MAMARGPDSTTAFWTCVVCMHRLKIGTKTSMGASSEANARVCKQSGTDSLGPDRALGLDKYWATEGEVLGVHGLAGGQ